MVALVARDAFVRQLAVSARACLLVPIWQYHRLSATSHFLGEQASRQTRDRGRSRSYPAEGRFSGVRVELEESKLLALGLPREGQAGVFHQPVRGERNRLPAVQDRRDNVGCEEGEPDEARDVGTDDPFLRGNLSEG
jgi:hypothetical protein